MNRMTIWRVFLLPVLVLLCSSVFAQPVDEKLVKYIDLTGDGNPEKVTLTLKAKDFKEPMRWMLTISSGKKVLLRRTKHDLRTEQFFEPRYVLSCSDYIDCKKKWYYQDLLDSLVVTSSGYDIEGILNRNQENTLHHLGKSYLAKCCQIGSVRAERILTEIEQRIRAGTAVMVTIPDKPATAGPLLTFCPQIGRFVPVYED